MLLQNIWLAPDGWVLGVELVTREVVGVVQVGCACDSECAIGAWQHLPSPEPQPQ